MPTDGNFKQFNKEIEPFKKVGKPNRNRSKNKIAKRSRKLNRK